MNIATILSFLITTSSLPSQLDKVLSLLDKTFILLTFSVPSLVTHSRTHLISPILSFTVTSLPMNLDKYLFMLNIWYTPCLAIAIYYHRGLY